MLRVYGRCECTGVGSVGRWQWSVLGVTGVGSVWWWECRVLGVYDVGSVGCWECIWVVGLDGVGSVRVLGV